MKKEQLSKSDYILDRLEKAVYMGFVLDKKSNDCLGKKISLDFPVIDRYITNYNDSISKKGYPIRLLSNSTKTDLEIRYLGEFLYVNPESFSNFIRKVESRINSNLTHALKSYKEEGVEIFDLDLLVELRRTGVTTMGDTYKGYNGMKYTVNFMHLYSVISA